MSILDLEIHPSLSGPVCMFSDFESVFCMPKVYLGSLFLTIISVLLATFLTHMILKHKTARFVRCKQ